MIPVTKTFLPPQEAYQAYLDKIWESGWLTNNGQFELELANQLSGYLDVAHIELVSNGTLALQLAIRALGLTGEIITTPFTYVATATAIAWENCTPVFVDIDQRTLCIDPAQIEAAITPKTSAILPVHVYGYACDVQRIGQIAGRYNLKVIYDAAHCFGVRLNGQSLLRWGDIATLSFHATKLFHTAEGGALVCRQEEVARRVYLMKKFGHIGEEDYREIGINAKMSELHAAMGLCVLPLMDGILARRRQICERYDDLIAGSGLARPLLTPGLDYNYAYYPVVFPSHQAMTRTREALAAGEIFPRRYFYPSLNTLPYLQQAGYRACPVSEDMAQRVLCLPLYNDLSDGDVERIAAIVRKAAS